MTRRIDRSPRIRRPLSFAVAARRLLPAVVAAGAAQSASAQVVNFTSHGGQDTAYCGLPANGPVVQHSFFTTAATHDAISVSDPGGPSWPASSATAQLDAVPAVAGLSIAVSGSGSRAATTANGVYATGDSRDSWEFTVSVPTHFTFAASLSALSTEATIPNDSFQLAAFGGGAQVIPDPGTPPSAFYQTLSTPGSISTSGSGTLLPGLYYATIHGRVEGNTYPFAGSFSHSLAIGFECGNVVSYCTSGVTTNGCTAQMHGSGTPSASLSSGFTLDVTGMEGASQGMIFYGVSGRAALPWGTSSSFVCIKAPTQRTGAQNGGGSAGSCNGAMTLDWNNFVSNHPSALGVPFSAGQLVQAQGWFRDPPSPKTTMLSDAVEFAVCP